MKHILFLLFLFGTTILLAQKLDNCSNCATQEYSAYNISKNKLFEIELLRNEIFARHNYEFNNQRLNEYFSDYDWHHPNITDASIIKLNAFETHNILVFKKREQIIKKNRALLIKELSKLKQILNDKDIKKISNVFSNALDPKDSVYNSIVSTIGYVLNSIDLKEIHWFKGVAKYQIKTDNGFSVSVKEIYLSGDTITIILSDPATHSRLMDEDAFYYPSEYHSESETNIGGTFKIIDGKLVLISPIFAG